MLGSWVVLRKNHATKTINGSIFLSLAMFSWSLVAIYKFSDPVIPPLVNAINDRLMSAFSNIFLLASVPFFTDYFDRLRLKIPIIRSKESWITSVFIFFAIIALMFTLADRNATSDWMKMVVVVLDTILSVFSIFLSSSALYQSLNRGIWTTRFFKKVAFSLFGILILTQITFPIIAFNKESLGWLYFPQLVLFLVSLVFFIFVAFSYYSFYEEPATTVAVENLFKLTGIRIGYNSIRKECLLTLCFTDQNGKDVEDTIESKKILQPFANWVVFALSKEKGVKLWHMDIATIKFRMVEYWNKSSRYQINQDMLFTNYGGKFDLELDAAYIQLEQREILKNKFIIRESIGKFSSCFPNPSNLKGEEFSETLLES